MEARLSIFRIAMKWNQNSLTSISLDHHLITLLLMSHPIDSKFGTTQLTCAFRAGKFNSRTSILTHLILSGAYSPSKLSSSSNMIHSANFPANLESHNDSRLGCARRRAIDFRLKVFLRTDLRNGKQWTDDLRFDFVGMPISIPIPRSC